MMIFDDGGEIPLPRPWSWRESAFIAEFYSRPKYNLHSWLLAWTGIFYFTRPLSECKGFYTPLDDQQCFLSFEINSLNRESWSQSLINFRCFISTLTLNKECLILNSHILHKSHSVCDYDFIHTCHTTHSVFTSIGICMLSHSFTVSDIFAHIAREFIYLMNWYD